MISFSCCPSSLPLLIALIGPLLSLTYFKRSATNLLLIKALSYAVSMIGLAFVSYAYYNMIESFVTGFIYPTPELIELTLIVVVLGALLKLFELPINFSLFDIEFSQIKGLMPKTWLTLVYVSSAYAGAQLAFFQGFLLAHVTSLSLLVVGYEVRGLRRELGALALFGLTNYVSGIYLPVAYSSAVSAVVVLLLWKAGGKALRELREALVRGALLLRVRER